MKKILGLFLLGGLLMGCDDDDDDRVPISLSSRIEIETRADLQTTQIEQGQEVSLFVMRNGSTTETVYSNEIIVADGKGGFSRTYGTLYYPADDIDVDFYAIHPYKSGNRLSGLIELNVETNQSSKENFLNSDVLYASKKDVSKTDDKVELVFSHKMSKIMIEVRQGQDLTMDDLEEIRIENVVTGVSLDPLTGEITTVVDNTQAITAYGITKATNNQTEMTGIAALVAPQTFSAASGKALFKVNIDNKELVYIPTSDVTFRPGYSYKFILTILNTGITATYSIVDWETGNTISN